MEYRPAPFWSWNDELTPDQLRHQNRAAAVAAVGDLGKRVRRRGVARLGEVERGQHSLAAASAAGS